MYCPECMSMPLLSQPVTKLPPCLRMPLLVSTTRITFSVFDKNKEEAGQPFTEYRIIEVQKGVSDGGFTEIILPEGFDIGTAKVVIKGAYNLLSAKKNAGEMAC